MGEWWINNTGTNMLKGIVGDESNPARLDDDVIVDFLRRIPAARESFERLVPSMLADERERLQGLAASAYFVTPDYKAVEDSFQSSQNKAGVRTSGPFAGQRRGGNN